MFGGIPTNSTRVAYGLAPTNNAATANFDKNVVIVTNNIRSRTPTFETAGSTNAAGNSNLAPYIDSVTYASWFNVTGGSAYTGPYNWLGSNTWYNLSVNNRYFYTEQTGVRLTNPYTLTGPNFFPTSSSPIVVTTGPTTGVGIDATGHTPIGTNGTNAFTKVSATFTGRFNNAFFDKTVTYIGAFGFGGTDWTLQWTNWDPNSTDYGAAY
jgi:hypothetical protein